MVAATVMNFDVDTPRFVMGVYDARNLGELRWRLPGLL
jgi:hypothetical protein